MGDELRNVGHPHVVFPGRGFSRVSTKHHHFCHANSHRISIRTVPAQPPLVFELIQALEVGLKKSLHPVAPSFRASGWGFGLASALASLHLASHRVVHIQLPSNPPQSIDFILVKDKGLASLSVAARPMLRRIMLLSWCCLEQFSRLHVQQDGQF